MFISMNYENSCMYLCFYCVDVVDCGVGVPHPVDSRLRGNDGPGDLQDCGDAVHRWGVAAFHGADLHGWVWIDMDGVCLSESGFAGLCGCGGLRGWMNLYR